MASPNSDPIAQARRIFTIGLARFVTQRMLRVYGPCWQAEAREALYLTSSQVLSLKDSRALLKIVKYRWGEAFTGVAPGGALTDIGDLIEFWNRRVAHDDVDLLTPKEMDWALDAMSRLARTVCSPKEAEDIRLIRDSFRSVQTLAPEATEIGAPTPVYSKRITRENPVAFFLLVDQSGSMQATIGGGTRPKAEAVAEAINELLDSLGARCAKGEERPTDYFHVGVIGYGSSVGPAFGGRLAARSLVPISEVMDNPIRMVKRTVMEEDWDGRMVEGTIHTPIWFEPKAGGETPMCRAFGLAASHVRAWIQAHPDGTPPVVINITDGRSTDGDPTDVASTIRSLGTSDGKVLLMNMHVSVKGEGREWFLPDSDAELPGLAQTLFSMSSILPKHLRDAATEFGVHTTALSRGFAFNTGLAKVVQFLELGSHTSRPL
jgi:hypothetical protein